MNRIIAVAGLAFALAASSSAFAASPPAAYALIVASEQPGPGQESLRYAKADAERIYRVLTELGGYQPDSIVQLLDPRPAEIEAALDALEARLAARAERDEPTTLLFYYSGHARSGGLSLGADELPLPFLKDRLAALPATVRLVILDACQSGAISDVKGVEPAASFSHNSVAGLSTEGMAVMASSSASELSQESPEIGGSFFTHHLVSGLRGAADQDGDGRVTLAEAYRYAYNRTLVATAATAVGKQHVTLETELRGKGEMVLTWPTRAGARLELPAELDAEVLVYRVPGDVVVAEVFKSEGDRLLLALPAGDYAALIRRGEQIERCPFALGARGLHALDADAEACEPVEQVAVTAKSPEDGLWRPTWSFELGTGFLNAPKDAFDARLEDFGYREQFDLGTALQVHLTGLYHLDRFLAAGLTFATLDRRAYEREGYSSDTETRTSSFRWSAWSLGVQVRGGLPLLDGYLEPYVQAGGGVTLGLTTLDGEDGESTDETHWGYQVGASVGLQAMFWRHLGGFLQAGYTYAPTIDNLLGDTHNSGGFGASTGLRAAF